MTNVLEQFTNFDVNKEMDKFKEAPEQMQKFAMENSKVAIDSFVKSSEQWQEVAQNAVKSSLEVAAKQQELFFSTMEQAKTQFEAGMNRSRDFFQVVK